MKKIRLLLLFLPLLASAKFYPGEVKFADGSSRSGFIEVVDTDEQKLPFRATEKGEKEKLSIDDISGFSIVIDNNTLAYIASYVLNPRIIKGKMELSKQKQWLCTVYLGKIKIYYAYSATGKFSPGNIAMADTSRQRIFYITRENQENPQFCFIELTVAAAGIFKYEKKAVEAALQEDCPNFKDLLKKDEVKEKGWRLIGELYDANCGVK